MTVLVYDSGIGGLSVLREARILMPEHRFVYVADGAVFPIGSLEEGVLIEHLTTLFDRLVLEHSPRMIVVACNTASTVILPHLRERFDIPVVGTVPAIKLAAEVTSTGQISVLATPGTVQRDYTRSLISEFASRVNVRLVGAENLARLAEGFMLTGQVDKDAVGVEIGDCFVDRLGARTDVVVLACTHYPFLTNVFRRLAPWPVDWLNPAEAIARHAQSLVGDGGDVIDVQDIAIFTGGEPKPEMRRLLSGFGLSVQNSN